MSAVASVADRKDRPAHVRFKRVAYEDKVASLRDGRWVGKDVDIAMITPPYSKDVIEMKVVQWLSNMKQDVQNGRIHPEWAEQYEKDYERWKNGQEIPLRGTPIKGWGVISPAQQESLLKLNILTVEDLAGVNDEGIRRIGMGSMDLKNKATAWLAQMGDKGPLTVEIAALKAENAEQKVRIDTLTAQVEQMSARLNLSDEKEQTKEQINAVDIIEPIKRGPGRPPKQ